MTEAELAIRALQVCECGHSVAEHTYATDDGEREPDSVYPWTCANMISAGGVCHCMKQYPPEESHDPEAVP